MLDVGNAVVAASLLIRVASTEPADDGALRRVVLINNTHVPVAEIYISDDNAENWQLDLLGSEFLLPDDSVLVPIDDQNGNCRIDLRAILDDGSILVNRALDICRSPGKPVTIR